MKKYFAIVIAGAFLLGTATASFCGLSQAKAENGIEQFQTSPDSLFKSLDPCHGDESGESSAHFNCGCLCHVTFLGAAPSYSGVNLATTMNHPNTSDLIEDVYLSKATPPPRIS